MYQNFDLSSQSLRTLVSIFQTFLYVSPMTIENVSMCILSHYTPNFNQSVILIFMMYDVHKFFLKQNNNDSSISCFVSFDNVKKMYVYVFVFLLLAWYMYASACKINLMQLLLWTPEAIQHRCCLPYFFLYSMQEYGCSNQLMYTFNI